ncbi:MAG: ATP-binding domain-containing protein, partial [Planctomycetaceae bacterium]
IIVDEAQDFSTDWWIPIEHLLADSATSFFYIFHDPKQNIFDRENELPFTHPSMLLDVNCRNTNRIADYVNELADIDAHSAGFVADGISPVEHVISSPEEELEVTSDTLQNLITREHIDPQRIVIIGRYRFENSPFADKSILKGIRIVDEASGSIPKDAVRYATLFRFKGLETDCAILSGFQRPQSEQRARELYVAASRAKMLLHLMYRSDAHTP